MKWTTNKPTEPGWYWVDEHDSWKPSIVLVHKHLTGGTLVAQECDACKTPVSEYNSSVKWSGPIQEPEAE